MASKKGKRSLASILCSMAGIIIIIAIILICLPMTVPRIMGDEVYTIVSGSMEPTIPVGSLVYIDKMDPKDLQESDIAAFLSGGSVVVHRVIENHVIDGELITQGDANPAIDAEPVPYANVIGKVAWHVPILGDYMQIFSSMIGKIYLFGALLCGILFMMLGGRLKKSC